MLLALESGNMGALREHAYSPTRARDRGLHPERVTHRSEVGYYTTPAAGLASSRHTYPRSTVKGRSGIKINLIMVAASREQAYPARSGCTI